MRLFSICSEACKTLANMLRGLTQFYHYRSQLLAKLQLSTQGIHSCIDRRQTGRNTGLLSMSLSPWMWMRSWLHYTSDIYFLVIINISLEVFCFVFTLIITSQYVVWKNRKNLTLQTLEFHSLSTNYLMPKGMGTQPVLWQWQAFAISLKINLCK